MLKKILIVDDNDTVRILLKMSLASDEYLIIEADDGQSAFSIVNKEKPDLIISDILMPNMNGFDFCKKVREKSVIPTVPFIFLSALNEVSTELRSYRTGADDYIVKSNLNRSELQQKVKNMLKRGQEYKKIEEAIDKGMTGRLSDLAVVEIVQLINTGKKSGHLTITHENNSALITFKDGQIVYAKYLDYIDEAAIYKLSSWTNGVFKFVPSDEIVNRTVIESTKNIIAEYCRLINEQQFHK